MASFAINFLSQFRLPGNIIQEDQVFYMFFHVFLIFSTNLLNGSVSCSRQGLTEFLDRSSKCPIIYAAYSGSVRRCFISVLH